MHHRQVAAAISTALGFTTPLRNSTIGVTATASPVVAHVGDGSRRVDSERGGQERRRRAAPFTSRMSRTPTPEAK